MAPAAEIGYNMSLDSIQDKDDQGSIQNFCSLPDLSTNLAEFITCIRVLYVITQ